MEETESKIIHFHFIVKFRAPLPPKLGKSKKRLSQKQQPFFPFTDLPSDNSFREYSNLFSLSFHHLVPNLL